MATRLTTIEVEEYGAIEVHTVGPYVVLEPDSELLRALRDEGAVRLHFRESSDLRWALETAEQDLAREGWTE